VTAGQTFTITASGEVNPCVNNMDTNPVCQFYGPEGGMGPVQDSPPAIFPLPGANGVALVGRIRGGKVFLVGAGGTFTADSSGTLQFAVNDDQPRNNAGEFTVTIEVMP
jgi:hypothetical protein